MRNTTGRYSGYIRPFSYVSDVLILSFFGFYFFNFPQREIPFYLLLSSVWLIIAAQLGFYEVYRYTKVVSILNCAVKQFVLFTISLLSIVYLYGEQTSFTTLFSYLGSVASYIVILKLVIYYFLKEFRLHYGGNLRRVILIGSPEKVASLQTFFSENLEYGYKVCNSFSLEENIEKELQEAFSFIVENKMDEVYCAMSDLTQPQIQMLIDFANNNLKTLKFIPDDNQILSGSYVFQYYGYLPIIALRDIRLDETYNKIAKRIFDILFSVLVIVGVLSWLTPILAFLIKLESKGPVFYKHQRNGLSNKVFTCYKFRSMQFSKDEKYDPVSKVDSRVTAIGQFLRQTSLDEFPQFYNVLKGEMSVVGPRPHMISYTEQYALKVNNFMIRHFIKPGITGLAQTKGYRGAVENDSDIINRFKYDIFYMENWSILLDIEIILKTIYNILKGDEKAY